MYNPAYRISAWTVLTFAYLRYEDVHTEIGSVLNNPGHSTWRSGRASRWPAACGKFDAARRSPARCNHRHLAGGCSGYVGPNRGTSLQEQIVFLRREHYTTQCHPTFRPEGGCIRSFTQKLRWLDKFQALMTVFWAFAPCSLVQVFRRFRGSKYFSNVGKFLPVFAVQQLRRLPSLAL